MIKPTQKQKLHAYLSEVEKQLPSWPAVEPEYRMINFDGHLVKQLREGRVVIISRPILRSILAALETKPRSQR
jgi:hypothetical protein